MSKTIWETLSVIDVSAKVEKKGKLTYLSWAWAWATVKAKYPLATYEVKKNDLGLPYFESDEGFMCFVEITIEDLTHEMWLPVMDGSNQAMKAEPYKYATKYGDKEVAAATMFDINKTLMRCLVKCLAMFGLGHYIYAGEDLPQAEPEPQSALITTAQAGEIRKVLDLAEIKEADYCKKCGIQSIESIGAADFTAAIGCIKRKEQ